eukprot:gnl/MRDRNA2_/MRDRNA2_104100_c0_seq1.p1 gnl/MRDRNA2_/MRDRNA2_104100_c0~~gnl/MRDRNA2_/MRDRNA2_104100_c0_seq1.p1  ORF type:complete len:424 (+),score=61.84 gnl/MRDRNA2_/MRDRNA2_104100_c0_seq1:81-1274(+)
MVQAKAKADHLADDILVRFSCDDGLRRAFQRRVDGAEAALANAQDSNHRSPAMVALLGTAGESRISNTQRCIRSDGDTNATQCRDSLLIRCAGSKAGNLEINQDTHRKKPIGSIAPASMGESCEHGPSPGDTTVRCVKSFPDLGGQGPASSMSATRHSFSFEAVCGEEGPLESLVVASAAEPDQDYRNSGGLPEGTKSTLGMVGAGSVAATISNEWAQQSSSLRAVCPADGGSGLRISIDGADNPPLWLDGAGPLPPPMGTGCSRSGSAGQKFHSAPPRRNPDIWQVPGPAAGAAAQCKQDSLKSSHRPPDTVLPKLHFFERGWRIDACGTANSGSEGHCVQAPSRSSASAQRPAVHVQKVLCMLEDRLRAFEDRVQQVELEVEGSLLKKPCSGTDG